MTQLERINNIIIFPELRNYTINTLFENIINESSTNIFDNYINNALYIIESFIICNDYIHNVIKFLNEKEKVLFSFVSKRFNNLIKVTDLCPIYYKLDDNNFILDNIINNEKRNEYIDIIKLNEKLFSKKFNKSILAKYCDCPHPHGYWCACNCKSIACNISRIINDNNLYDDINKYCLYYEKQRILKEEIKKSFNDAYGDMEPNEIFVDRSNNDNNTNSIFIKLPHNKPKNYRVIMNERYCLTGIPISFDIETDQSNS
jgi:hypothetical protein